MNQTEIVKREGMTLAALIWQVMGSQPESFVETVLTANPGLSSLGPVLPVGTKVVLPLDQVRTEQPEEQAVRLWD